MSLAVVLAALGGCAADDPAQTGGPDLGSSGGAETSSTAPGTTSVSGSSTAGTVTSAGGTTPATSEPPSTTDEDSTTTTDAVVECEAVPACIASLPDVGPDLDWEHTESTFVTASGSERHRGRDMFYNPDDTHWVMGKFAYGATDWDLSDERVDLFLLEGCEGQFEFLDTVFTTNDGDHPTVEGVEDSGGWVFYEMPRPLPVGRHRIHMVVRGDGTRTDTFIEVVEPGTPIFLSDVDGTLTTSEWARVVDLLLDTVPDVNPGAPEAFALLVERGYRPMYLTARPEFLGKRTYEFVAENDLPPGIIHTSLSTTGALGDAAVAYKSGELAALAGRGLVPAFVFGNTDSDSEAYENAGIEPLDHRVFVEFEDPRGGRTIQSYEELLGEFEQLDPVCE